MHHSRRLRSAGSLPFKHVRWRILRAPRAKLEWNEMQFQLQNWYHFDWLSGNDPPSQTVDPSESTRLPGCWATFRRCGPGAWADARFASNPSTATVRPSSHRPTSMPTACGLFSYCRLHPRLLQRGGGCRPRREGPGVHARPTAIEGEKPWRYKGRPAEHEPMSSRKNCSTPSAPARRSTTATTCVSSHARDSRSDGLLYRARSRLGAGPGVEAELWPCRVTAWTLSRRSSRAPTANIRRPCRGSHSFANGKVLP